MLKRRLDQMKKENQRLRTYQAFDYAEKTDIENLFLDCIEQCKKEQWRGENAKVGIRAASRGRSKQDQRVSSAQNDKVQRDGAKPQGVQFAMNGTIKEINLDPSGSDLKQKLVNDKASLICIFEEIFGTSQQPNTMLGMRNEHIATATSFQAASEINQRAGLKSAGMAGVSRRQIPRPPLAKSMQNFTHNDFGERDRSNDDSSNPL